MKNLIKGLVIGILLILAMGNACQTFKALEVLMTGKLETSTISYQSALSGIDSEGRCFLAITNVHTGRTTLFKVEDSKRTSFDPIAFQKGKQGRIIAEVAQ